MTNLEWLLSEIAGGIIQFKIEKTERTYFFDRANKTMQGVDTKPPTVILQLNPDWCDIERDNNE